MPITPNISIEAVFDWEGGWSNDRQSFGGIRIRDVASQWFQYVDVQVTTLIETYQLDIDFKPLLGLEHFSYAVEGNIGTLKVGVQYISNDGTSWRVEIQWNDIVIWTGDGVFSNSVQTCDLSVYKNTTDHSFSRCNDIIVRADGMNTRHYPWDDWSETLDWEIGAWNVEVLDGYIRAYSSGQQEWMYMRPSALKSWPPPWPWPKLRTEPFSWQFNSAPLGGT